MRFCCACELSRRGHNVCTVKFGLTPRYQMQQIFGRHRKIVNRGVMLQTSYRRSRNREGQRRDGLGGAVGRRGWPVGGRAVRRQGRRGTRSNPDCADVICLPLLSSPVRHSNDFARGLINHPTFVRPLLQSRRLLPHPHLYDLYTPFLNNTIHPRWLSPVQTSARYVSQRLKYLRRRILRPPHQIMLVVILYGDP